ncbi:MAG: hypothetical protein AAFX06_03935 [Planctomycetota bacterium]
MESIFYVVVATATLLALVDWRSGLIAAIVLDCFRDPVRKLSEGEPTLITYCVCSIWGAAFVNLIFSNNRGLTLVRQRFPWLGRSVVWYLLGLLPGALLSLVLYQNGVLLAGLGTISYAAPLLGLALGVAVAFDLKFLKRLLQVYLVVNCLALVGSVAEFLQWNWPALGGLKGFEWIRYMPGTIVRLISGFFRSPDIAGFHASNAMMVATILLLNRGDKPKAKRRINPAWVTALIWCVLPLLLCGRRKMLVIPIAFVVTYLLYMQLAARRSVVRIVGYLVLVIAIAAVPLSIYRDEEGLEDHQAYYATTLIDAAPRLRDNVGGGVVQTLKQSGMMGSGLGVATQGAQHLGGTRKNAWQEDGVSRLFKELGIPGVIMIAIAGFIVIQNCRIEIRRQNLVPLIEIQAMLFALFAANLGSFIVSHQHFSGDPANGLWVLLFVGVFLGSLALQLSPKAAKKNPGAGPAPPRVGKLGGP